jgi:hypothetical protein
MLSKLHLTEHVTRFRAVLISVSEYTGRKRFNPQTGALYDMAWKVRALRYTSLDLE